MSFILMGVILILCCFYGYIKYTDKKAEKLYFKALERFEEDKLDEALKIFEEVRKRYPISRYSKLSFPFLGYIYFSKGDYNKAILAYENFKKTMQSDIYTFLSVLSISCCYEEEKKTDEAIKILEDLIKRYPDNPLEEFALLKLEMLYRKKDKKRAKQILERFIRKYPESPFFYIAKARLLSYNK